MSYNSSIEGKEQNSLRNVEVLFGSTVLAVLISERKYDVTPHNGDLSRESNARSFSKQCPTVILNHSVHKSIIFAKVCRMDQ